MQLQEIQIFDVKLHPLYKSEFLDLIKLNLENGKQIIQVGVNAAIINEIVKNDEFKNTVKNADLINIDGMSVTWAMRFLGYNVPERVACPDLAMDVIKMAEESNYSIYLLGAQEFSVSLSKQKLKEAYPNLKIAGYRNGYFSVEEEIGIIDEINLVNPTILFLGMPSPQKEFFVEKYREKLNAKFIFGVGGFFDILSGYKKRAPHWMQVIGLEWFYRFIQEPHRMWRRYFIGNLLFIRLILKERMKKHS